MIGRVLSVRFLGWAIWVSCFGLLCSVRPYDYFACFWYSLLVNKHKLGQVCFGKQPTRTQRPPRPARLSCMPRSKPRKSSSASKRSWFTKRRRRRPTWEGAGGRRTEGQGCGCRPPGRDRG
jgi:hypothetical protein